MNVKNRKILTKIGINRHLFTAELLSALAWHSKSSGNISKNGITFPVCGSMQVFRRALCKWEKNKKLKINLISQTKCVNLPQACFCIPHLSDYEHEKLPVAIVSANGPTKQDHIHIVVDFHKCPNLQ